MTPAEREFEQSANEVLSELPLHLGFQLHRVNDRLYELHSELCAIQIGLDRHDSSSVTVSIIDPTDDPDKKRGMAFWVLRQIRGIPPGQKGAPDQFRQLGRTLAERFGDRLGGDFRCRIHYDSIERQIFDTLWTVRALPADHPTRKLFEDLRVPWLERFTHPGI